MRTISHAMLFSVCSNLRISPRDDIGVRKIERSLEWSCVHGCVGKSSCLSDDRPEVEAPE